jgi:eukaryotic-like serine/threonine-protein kinase
VVSALQLGDPRTMGPYRLEGRLGQGGMGQVFLGVSPGGRRVAVKAIRAELAADPQFRARFGREVAATRRVSGVFTAQVVDADTEGPVAWLATSFIQGPSLEEAVQSHGPLPEQSLLALAAGLAEGLNAIHAAGVVHRDLKPSNVLLTHDGPQIIDFGISRAAESVSLTQTGLLIGSPGFMSPEQAMGAETGPPSDIFSLGAVLAFASTGQGPFGTGTTTALLYRVAHGTPELDQVPATVRSLIERCLDKDPARRPTAAALLAEVGNLQPAANWLPETIIGVPTGGTGPVLASALTGPAAARQAADSYPQASASFPSAFPPGATPPAGTPPGGTVGQPAPGSTRGPRRPMLLAGILGALLVISVAAYVATALTGHSSRTAPTHSGQTHTYSPSSGQTVIIVP